ncbi:ABC transporter ATP-binding protein/permease [Clostridium algidicarnis]|uniref:ABC transporter ATP-binding protein n=1 Tax=Clostridium algidicarnis TaxID=37659 RepID=UPI001C0C5E56|nr:ABC transporter ATP-binding protein [Clostridium algidicarnis]MBU3206657.1 ABC transporter ATP-binding protein/permease [Clostridium algidicarnis]
MMEDRQKRHKTQAKGPMGGGPAMGRPVEKAKDFKGTMKRLITYLRPRRVSLIVVFIFAILSTVFSIVSPKVMGKATTKLFEGIMGKMALEKLLPQLDTLTKLSKNPATATPDVANSISAVNKKISEIMSLNGGKIDFDYIAHIVFILIGLYAISAIFAYVQQYVMAGVAQKTVFNMRKDVDEKLSRLPLKYFDSHTHGEILSRVTNDIDTVSSTLQQSLTQLITSVVTIIGIIVMMLTISPILTLVTIVTLPLSIFVTTNIAKRSQKYFADQQNALGRLNGHVEEMYTGHKIVKAFGHEHKSIGEFNYINEELYNVGWKAQFISGIIMPLMNFINNIGYVLVCVVGGIFVTKGRINLGDIQAFIQYSRQFGQPIVQTANIVNILQSTVAAAERVFEVLDEVEEIQDADITQVIESPKGEVKFENVNFGYEKDAMLIENMNIDVKPGQTIAIVGPTGAGKTTIVNLLMRFYEIDEGKITIDGIDIRNLKRGDLRNIFGMVLQDTWLFNGTIRDNIGYGRLGATEDEIILAAKAAHADHFIRTLPEGYDTILNEEASNISQGQKQLLTIARAILLDPSVLILDEATSSVDTRTEIYIQKAMTKLMQGRTSFVIAHRLSTIRDADLILVMNNGSIIEKGSHKELLEENGFYADLYNSQFKGARLEENAM